MKQVSFEKSMMALRISILVFILSVISIFLFSFRTVHTLNDDVWKQLGITESKGSEKIKASFMNGYLDYWGVKNARNLVTGNRGAVAKDLLAYTKNFLSSPQFKTAYEKERMLSRPVMDEFKIQSKEEIRTEQVGKMKQGIKQSEDLIKQYPDMEKSVKESIKELEKVIKEFESPESQMIEMFYQAQVQEAEMRKEQHQKDILDWEANYPKDHRQKIRGYLNRYISIAETVDFGAALTDRYGKKVFVNKTYEGKSDEWKMIFRAGKEVYSVAKPFAEQWLKEL